MFSAQKPLKKQTGAVLVISLILLLLLTLTGITGVQVTSLEEKMAGNSRDQNLAFQAAESALSAAERSLEPPNTLPSFTSGGTGGFYSNATSVDLSDSAISQTSFWVGGSSQPVATSGISSLGNGVASPLYFIREIPPMPVASPPHPAYKIVVRATGGTTNAVVILQSLYTLPP